MITILSLLACSGSPETPTPPAPEPAPETAKADKVKYADLFAPLPEVAKHPSVESTPAMVDLGRMLYFDKRLSKNHDISCNSCHPLDRFGADGEPTSPGHKGVRGDRNSPTSYNAALHFAQFWDGREPDVEAQAKGPVLNPVEMAIPSAEAAVATMKSIPGYVEAFAKAFPDAADPVTYDNFGAAVGAFERGLMTPGRFDAYLKGDASALTDAEKAGLETFVTTGCASCHMAVALGGNQYQKLGVVKPYETKDPGRFAVTQNEADRGMFKVPSLRNVAETGPYYHDGSIATLDEAVKTMAAVQLGKELSSDEVASIVTFLKSLTGELPKAYIQEPTLPASGPTTPKPDPS